MDIAEAALLLGMKESEVVDVVESDIGPVIRTKDNQIMVVVDDVDGEGRSGLMFLVAPSANYGGTFPVYAPSAGSVVDREAVNEYLDTIGAGDLAEAAGTGEPRLNEAEVSETVEALTTDAGPLPEAVEEPVDPGAPENIPEPGRADDPGTTAPVPEGNRETVLDWVGDDPVRARQALDAENARPTPRTTLVADLEARLAPAES